MKRFQLFEFMDLKWYPEILRNIQTNILQVIMNSTSAFDYVVPYIDKILDKTKCYSIIDLCSGASGPWLRIYDKLKHDSVKIFLSDKYPNIEMFNIVKRQTDGKIDFIEYNMDVMNTEYDTNYVYTMFTAFHHFAPDEIKSILLYLQQSGASFCAFDYAPNKTLTIILSPLTFILSILQFYFLSFRVKPFTITQFFFTNVLPIVPIVAAWDGIVSALRKYTVDDLIEITEEIKDRKYTWEIGHDKSLSKSTPLVYLLGYRNGSAKNTD